MIAHHNIGLVYHKKNEYKNALSHLDTALTYSTDLNAKKND